MARSSSLSKPVNWPAGVDADARRRIRQRADGQRARRAQAERVDVDGARAARRSGSCTCPRSGPWPPRPGWSAARWRSATPGGAHWSRHPRAAASPHAESPRSATSATTIVLRNRRHPRQRSRRSGREASACAHSECNGRLCAGHGSGGANTRRRTSSASMIRPIASDRSTHAARAPSGSRRAEWRPSRPRRTAASRRGCRGTPSRTPAA